MVHFKLALMYKPLMPDGTQTHKPFIKSQVLYRLVHSECRDFKNNEKEKIGKIILPSLKVNMTYETKHYISRNTHESEYSPSNFKNFTN